MAKSHLLRPELLEQLEVKGAAGTGATDASAPVNFLVQVHRTRPEDRDKN